MYYRVEDVLNRIELMKPEAVLIFDGIHKDLKGKSYNVRLYGSPEELTKQVKDLFDTLTGAYTVVLKPTKTSPIPSSAVLQINSPRVENAEIIDSGFNPASYNNDFDTSKMREEIRADILKDLSIKQIEQENIELKLEIKESSKPAYKIAALGQILIEKFLLQKVSVSTPPLNGGKTMNLTPVNEVELNEAFLNLTNYLGADTIIKLADKLGSSGDASMIINMVKNYAND